jgi:Flp pilus assembly protein TadG
MFKNVRKKLRSDRGDSTIVSLVFVIPLLLGLLFTIFDISLYFSNRAYIQTVAHNGARTVSIMGGNGNATQSTPIEAKYGMTKADTCGTVSRDGRSGDALKSTSTAIECNMMGALQDASGLVNVSIKSVKCTPDSTETIGERTSCEIKWSFGGTPGSGMALIPANAETGKHFGEENITAGSAESEVNLGGALVTRR